MTDRLDGWSIILYSDMMRLMTSSSIALQAMMSAPRNQAARKRAFSRPSAKRAIATLLVFSSGNSVPGIFQSPTREEEHCHPNHERSGLESQCSSLEASIPYH
jgi:hypothetical protein